MGRGIWLIVAFVLLAGGLTGPVASASAADFDVNLNIGRSGDRYVLKGPVDLRRGEVARSVIVGDGQVTVREGATVTDDLFVADGDVLVAGTVRGRIVTLGGRATLAPTAVVGDGIRYGSDRPVVAPGARVTGGVEKLDRNWDTGAKLIPALAWWVAMTVSTLVLGLLLLWLVPRVADATFEQMRDGGWGPAIGVGFALVIGLPLLAVIALVTFVGIPFGIGLLLALVPLAAVGYVTGAWVIGRGIVGPPGSRFGAFLAGWAILRVVGLIPFVGALVFFVTAMFGVGALVWTLLRSPRASRPAGGPESPLSPTI